LRAGFDVWVGEQASELKDTGAGINIGPNASRILYRLGIPHELERTSVKPATFDQRRWDDGRLLLRSPLGEAVETSFGAPRYMLHRGDLHRALRGVIPPARMHLGHRFVCHKDRVTASRRISKTGRRSRPVCLSAPDGIHSSLRRAMFRIEGPRFTGCVVVEVGAGVARVKLGDKVAGCFFQRWPGGEPPPECTGQCARRQHRRHAGGIRGVGGALRGRHDSHEDNLLRLHS
jgi:salicylate hydroxylase